MDSEIKAYLRQEKQLRQATIERQGNLSRYLEAEAKLKELCEVFTTSSMLIEELIDMECYLKIMLKMISTGAIE